MQTRALAAALALASLVACSSGLCDDPNQCTGSLVCTKPRDCGGNPCCLENSNTQSKLSCGASASDCVPFTGVDTSTTRLCTTAADCTAGGISTTATQCCPTTAGSHSFNVCASACQ